MREKWRTDSVSLEEPMSENMEMTQNSASIVGSEVPIPARGNWGAKIEFFFACIGYAIGLGNVWRFPYLCYRHGGGAFLIPYLLMLVFVAIPIFFMELAFGQFASLGTITIWTVSPLFKGIGYAMTYVSWCISVYYTVIIGTAFVYLFSSFTSSLPWSDCSNPWNNNLTCTALGAETTVLPNETTSPASEYYYNYILQKSDDFSSFSLPVWHLTLCVLFAWIVICLCLIKGVKSLGKVSYVTSTFPYVMIIILIIRTALLNGSLEGIKYYVRPNFTKLRNSKAWTDAATQIIFSLGCCNGSIITLSSYNKFKNNCYRDAVFVAVINCCTSLLAGFVVFATLGYMAAEKGVPISSVVESGPGLVFVVYPEVLKKMPVPTLWSILFFLMLITIGLGSVFAFVEAVLTSIQDEFRRFNFLKSHNSRLIFRILLCAGNFLIGLPLVCKVGIHLLNLIDSAVCGYSLLVICLIEIIVIIYIYGIKQFSLDVKLMTGSPVNWYWKICWLAVSPLIVLGLIISNLVDMKPFGMDDFIYPLGIQVLGHLIAIFPLFLVLGCCVLIYCWEGGWILTRELCKPVLDWGPAEEEHRLEFLREVCARRRISVQEVLKSAAADLDPELSNAEDMQELTGSVVTPGEASMPVSTSCLILSSLAKNDGFYQSKLNIAEKIVEDHVKDLSKQGVLTEQLFSNEQRIVNLVKQADATVTENPGIEAPPGDESSVRKLGLSNVIKALRSRNNTALPIDDEF